jgi:hypothetical protein
MGGVTHRKFGAQDVVNFVLLSGVLCKPMAVVMSTDVDAIGRLYKVRRTWSRLKHRDRVATNLSLQLPIRFSQRLSEWAYNNLEIGDQVVVVARLWSGENKGKPLNWLEVSRCSCSLPVQVGLDSRYVRVRLDVYNRMAAQCGEEMKSTIVPDRVKASVPWDDVDPFEIDPTVESAPLPKD